MLADRLRSLLHRVPVMSLTRGGMAGATLRLGGGTAVGQALVVATAPLLTRLYSPGEMGVFGVLMAFVGFASVGVNLRYDMAIIPAATDAEVDRLLLVAAGVSVPFSVCASALLYGLIEGRVLSFGALHPSAALAAFAMLLGTGGFTALRYWAIRRGRYDVIGRALVVQGVGRAGVPVAAGLAGLGWWGLAFGELAGRVLGAGELVRRAAGPARETLRRSTAADLRAIAAANWRYPLIVAPSALLDGLAAALPLPLLASGFGEVAAGQLLLVQRIAGVPAALIGASIADVFHAQAAELYRTRPEEVSRAVVRTVRRLAVIACVVYVPLGLLSPFVFGPVFGSDWVTAGRLVALMTPMHIASLAVSPVTRLYSVANRPEIKLIFDVASIAVPILAFAVLAAGGLGFWGSMAVYVGLTVLTFLAHLALTLWVSRQPPRLTVVAAPVRP